jgi:hypothetical protein
VFGGVAVEGRIETDVSASADPTSVTPAQLLDLSSWYLSVPDNINVTERELLGGCHDTAFEVAQAVQFTARCGDPVQPGSHFPRSELRELNPDGSKAAWSTDAGVHTMELTQGHPSPRGQTTGRLRADPR